MTLLGDITFLGYLVTAALAFILGFGRMLRHQFADQFVLAGLITDAEADLDAEVFSPSFTRLVRISYCFAGAFFLTALIAGFTGAEVPTTVQILGSVF